MSQHSKEVREPDAFIRYSDKILAALKPYTKLILAGVVVLFIAGLAWTAMSWQKERTEKQAQEAYFSAEKIYSKLDEQFEGAKNKIKGAESAIESLKKDTKNKDRAKLIAEREKEIAEQKAKLPSGDFEKDYAKAIEGFKKILVDFPKSNAALMSALYLSKIYTDAKKYDEALQALTKSPLDVGGDEFLGGIFNLRLGQAYEKAGDCEKAVSTWQKVISNQEMAFLHGDANLKMAVCYEQLNNPEMALNIYNKSGSNQIEAERNAKVRALIIGKRVTTNLVNQKTGETVVPRNTEVTSEALKKLGDSDLKDIRLADQKAQAELDKIEQAAREKKSAASVRAADKYKRILTLNKGQPNKG